MPTPPPDVPGLTPRRAFLRLAVLAPLAAGCASLRVGPGPLDPVAGPARPPGAADPLEAVRAFPLPPEAEPAFVFRAAVAPRPRGG